MQERGAAIKARAAGGRHEVADERARDVRLEEDRHLGRRDAARAQPAHRALARAAAHGRGRLEPRRIALRAVPVVALHARRPRGDHAARRRSRARTGSPPTKPRELANTKSASHEDTVAPSELVIRASTARAASSVSRARSIAVLHGEAPRVEEIQVRAPRRGRGGSASGSPAASSGAVWRAMAQAASTVRSRSTRRERSEVLALPRRCPKYTVTRECLVAVVLDGLDLAEAHGDRLADGGGGLGLGVARPARAGKIERAQRGRFERGMVKGKRLGRRACRAWSWGLPAGGSRARPPKPLNFGGRTRACDRRSKTR